jgi:tRNA G18 (ribose-2'-O)-methylase SpoU
MNASLAREDVADLGDPRLADYRNLRDAELLLRRDRFIVEGRGNLRVLLTRTVLRPESLLLSEAACAALEAELVPLVRGIPVFVAPQSVLDAVVGFRVHRGALAVCRRPAPRDPTALALEVLGREPAPRVIVLEGVRDADNVGGIFRAAMAFGARAVFLCASACDPLYRKAVRTSMGGSLCVPFARAEEPVELLSTLRAKGFCVDLCDRLPGPVALLFGTEGAGLSDAALAGADRRVRIGMEDGVDSLNVATAAAIGLHDLRARADARACRDGG